VQNRDVLALMSLLRGRADPNATDDLGEHVLFEAAASGGPEVMAMLLIHDADPGQASNSGMIASEVAGDEETKVLLDLFRGAPAEEGARQRALEALSAPLRRGVLESLAARGAHEAGGAPGHADAAAPVGAAPAGPATHRSAREEHEAARAVLSCRWHDSADRWRYGGTQRDVEGHGGAVWGPTRVLSDRGLQIWNLPARLLRRQDVSEAAEARGDAAVPEQETSAAEPPDNAAPADPLQLATAAKDKPGMIDTKTWAPNPNLNYNNRAYSTHPCRRMCPRSRACSRSREP